jgi:2'-5' RNA ligase
MIRAFIAIELSDDVRAAIGEVQERLKRARLGVKVSWTKVQNIHLTLQFLGNIPEDLAPKISATLAGIAQNHATFALPVGGVGAFPGVQRARVLWVGCEDAAGRLKALAKAVQAGMQEFGFEPEHREFAAHLTLGRIKFPRPDAALTKVLDSLRDCACGTLPVSEIHLFQSQLHPEGSIYTKLSSHRLKGD